MQECDSEHDISPHYKRSSSHLVNILFTTIKKEKNRYVASNALAYYVFKP